MSEAALAIAGYFIAPHVSQLRRYNPDASYRLEDMGCTPTSGTNGANTVTGRRMDADFVLSQIRPWQETDPSTPGWSLSDLDHAMAKLGIGFEIRSGRGRNGVRDAWNHNLAVVMQGDSEEFNNETCSGKFNGDHCIVVYPCRKLIYGIWHRWIADPICATGRWERETEIWAYAENLNSGIRYGVFTKAVAKVPPLPPPDTSTANHRAYFEHGAQVKVYSISTKGTILKQPNGMYYRIKPWNNADSSAPCTDPIHRKTADGQSGATTVTVLKGYYVRDVIAVYSDGVTVKEI